MALRLVRSGDGNNTTTSGDDAAAYPFGETALVVTFAAVDDLRGLRADQRLSLAATPEISPDDAYLVLPNRARDHLVTAFARGESGRVAQWFSDAWVVRAARAERACGAFREWGDDGGSAARLHNTRTRKA